MKIMYMIKSKEESPEVLFFVFALVAVIQFTNSWTLPPLCLPEHQIRY
jgi:hypothetical protein